MANPETDVNQEGPMPEVMIKIIGLVNGGYHPLSGQYVIAFDPTIRRDGTVWLDTTTDPAKATRYADAGAAFELWRAVSPNRPRRADGQPNRPMTAFTVSLERVAAVDPRDPDHSRPSPFDYHNCYRCKSGKEPCVHGNPHGCEYLHARDD